MNISARLPVGKRLDTPSLRSCTPVLVGSYNLSHADMTGCHLLPFRPQTWHLPSQFFPAALQLPHQVWAQAKPFQPPLLRNCEYTAQKAPVCLQISFHSKYFTHMATPSAVGVARAHSGVNEVLVVAGYFREEGAHDFKCLQAEKSGPVSFASLIGIWCQRHFSSAVLP